MSYADYPTTRRMKRKGLQFGYGKAGQPLAERVKDALREGRTVIAGRNSFISTQPGAPTPEVISDAHLCIIVPLTR